MYLHELTFETKEQAEKAARRIPNVESLHIIDVSKEVTDFVDVESAFDLRFRTTHPLPWWKRALIRHISRERMPEMPPIFNLDAAYEDEFWASA